MLIADLSGTPSEEPCAQVGTHRDASDWSRHEARAYIAAMIAVFGQAPEGYTFKVKANPHDFGTYYTVDLVCPDDPALQQVTFEEAAEIGLQHWREALMPAPIDYTGKTPQPIDPIDPSRHAIIRAIIASRPNPDGTYPTPDIAAINTNLRAAFPSYAANADAELAAA